MLRAIFLLVSFSSVLSFRNWQPSIRPKFVQHATTEESQVLAAVPTVEEWLGVAEPGLKRAVLGMFRACKEIAYKVRTASCDKMACFNDFGKFF
jgi:hypothetical protein